VREIKQSLYAKCVAYVAARIDVAEQAIATAQQSANEETKSSVGDKYETTRAMMQLEIEKNSVQLGESIKLRQALDKINLEKRSETIQIGSLVITDQSSFFLAISAGKISIGNNAYFAVSPSSPIGSKLLGLSAGDIFEFNGRKQRVLEIW
jgi:transcription elongation GreA/GreB family factor